MDTQQLISDIDDLSDVDTTTSSPNTNQVLTWDGSNWVPADAQSSVSSMDDLSDADTTSVPPVNGQALVWNSSQGAWTPGTVSGGGGGAEDLDDLNDVDVTTNPPTNGQSLVYNEGNSVWVPGTVSGGGGATVISDLDDVDSTGATDGQVLKWNNGAGEWQPANDETGSGGSGDINEGDINIYVNTTGDDLTGDGSSGSPYATIERAVEHANGVITTAGIITILCATGQSHPINTSIKINHPSNIIINGQNSTITSTLESGNSTPLFDVFSYLFITGFNAVINNEIIDQYDNSNVTIDNCNFECYSIVIQPQASYNKILKMISSTFAMESTIYFTGYNELYASVVEIDLGIINTKSKAIIISGSDSSFLHFNFINGPREAEIISASTCNFKHIYVHCDNTVEFVSGTIGAMDRDGGSYYFNDCKINNMTAFFKAVSNGTSRIGFDYSNVNDLRVDVDDSTDGLDDCLVIANLSTIKSPYLVRQTTQPPLDSSWSGDLVIGLMSEIHIGSVDGFAPLLDTDPKYSSPGDNYVFDGVLGGVIYIHENTFNLSSGEGGEGGEGP